MIRLKVKEIFDLNITTNSSWMTKAFVNSHKGTIPVYGASLNPNDVGYGYIEDNVEKVKYFEDCLTWNIDGSTCVIHKRKGRFSLSEKVIPLIIFEKWKGLLDEDYLRIVIKSEAENYGFGFSNKAGKNKLGNITIDIPTLNDKIDITKQKKFVEKHNQIDTIKQSLCDDIKSIKNSFVVIDANCDKLSVSLSDDTKFSLSIGQRVLKKDIFCEGIPLYSSNVYKPFGYVSASVIDDFQEPSLIWGIDGNFDWNFIEPNIEFSITDHCGRLLVKDKNINAKYVFYQLLLTKEEYGFNRNFRSSMENIKEYITIDIPIKENGKFDLEAQNRIVDKYDSIMAIKNKLVNSLEECLEFKVEL